MTTAGRITAMEYAKYGVLYFTWQGMEQVYLGPMIAPEVARYFDWSAVERMDPNMDFDAMMNDIHTLLFAARDKALAELSGKWDKYPLPERLAAHQAEMKKAREEQ